jgi:hypothetical protein
MTYTYLRLYVPISWSISEPVTFLWLYLIEGAWGKGTTDNFDSSLRCVTGKHKGHTVSNMKESIDEIRKTFRKEMNTKLNVIQTSRKQVETGIVTLISYRHYLKIIGNNKLWPDMQKESWNIHLTKILNCSHTLASAREIATCKQNVGQKEDFIHSNFQMDISLPWIDAAFT